MRAVIQRVSFASVKVNQEIIGSIKNGILVLLGVENEDNDEDIKWLANKIVNLRIFDDDNGVMNLSLLSKSFEVLLISQFTLHASTKKGNRPSYLKAAKPEISKPMYLKFADQLSLLMAKEVQTGEFGADMKVELLNDGPVTIIIDSKNKE